MGRNTVSIISMNSARHGMASMAPSHQSEYLAQLIEGARPEPDICFLPGDNGKHLDLNVVLGYDQYNTADSGQAVLLYDTNRIQMNRPNVSFNTFGHLPGLDVDKMVCPMVKVNALPPVSSVVKEFCMVSWQRTLFSTDDKNESGDLTILQCLIKFSQMFAQSTNRPVFIGGEIPLRYDQVTSIVKQLSQDENKAFLTQVGNGVMPESFLPSMTNGSTRSIRHKFMMEVFRCSRNATWDTNTISDCFIASKELQLTETKLMNVENVLGRQAQIKMEPLKKFVPVQTQIKYENRPPRHSGG